MFNFKNLKIMKLENLNLVELNAQEVQCIDGGFFGLDDAAWIGIGVGLALGIITTQDLDDLAAAFHAGVKAGSK